MPEPDALFGSTNRRWVSARQDEQDARIPLRSSHVLVRDCFFGTQPGIGPHFQFGEFLFSLRIPRRQQSP